MYSPKQEPSQYSHPSRFSSMDTSAISHLGSSKQVTVSTNLTALKFPKALLQQVEVHSRTAKSMNPPALPVHLFIHPHIRPSISPSIHPFVPQFVHSSIRLSVIHTTYLLMVTRKLVPIPADFEGGGNRGQVVSLRANTKSNNHSH